MYRLLPALALCVGSVSAQTTVSEFFSAIRSDDRAAIRRFASDKANLALRDKSGVTPLLYSTTLGNIETMKALVEAGAGVNDAASSGATPLLWGACDPERVRLLLERGAAVDAKTSSGLTPLIVASTCASGTESVRMLLAKGADVNASTDQKVTALLQATDSGGIQTAQLLLDAGARAAAADGAGYTPLMNAAGWNDVALVKLLLAKGAGVTDRNAFSGKVVHGDIAMKSLTPLMFATPQGSPELVRALLDAGADVKARDSRGMTPLMFAVATEQQNPRVVRVLIERGSDVNAVSGAGESILDWARKFNDAAVISLLEKAGAKGNPVPVPPVRKAAPPAARAAVERSVQLLQTNQASFFKESNCIACHHQPMAAMAARAAMDAGIAVDEKALEIQKRSMLVLLAPRPSSAFAMEVGPAGLGGAVASSLALSSLRQAPNMNTDSVSHYVAVRQSANGGWEESHGIARAPLYSSAITQAVNSVRVLQLYPIPSRQKEFDARIARARAWLLEATAKTDYERAELLLGLYWTGASSPQVKRAAVGLVRGQRPDGGWRQRPGLESDAYATGLALRGLRESGEWKHHENAYKKGIDFLLRTQLEDGSWYVRSRAVKLQPYFQSGFPYDHEQWISYTATAYAAAAIAASISPAGVRASR